MRDTDRAVRLAATARLLALGFSPPTEETLAELEAIAQGLQADASPPPELADLLEADWGGLPADYERLFGRRCRCIYESSYERDSFRAARELEEIAGYYRAFGADTGGSRGDRPDHVGAELDFLAYLAGKRLAPGDESSAICRGAEDAFLTEHLGRWFPEFCRRTTARATGFYSALARLGARFIGEELDHRRLRPERGDAAGGEAL